MSEMRNKRSFALSVVDSDSFLSLPRSARLLYYDLGMRADDRGFIPSPRRLLRSIDAPEKDLKVLLQAGYVYQFFSGVVVILDWPVHNSVRRDRFIETTCLAELAQLEWHPGRRYHVVQSGDSASPSVAPVAHPDSPPVRTYPATNEDSSAWQNDTMNGSTANAGREPSGSQVCQPTGKPVRLSTVQPHSTPSDNHEVVAADAQVQPPDTYHVARLVEIMSGWGMTKEQVNQLIKLTHIKKLTESQIQYAYNYAQEHATTNTLAYLDKILRSSRFFDSENESENK